LSSSFFATRFGADDFKEPPVVAAPQKRPEYQVNIQKLKKQSSPPRPRAIVVHNPNNINLPALNIPDVNTNVAITGRGSGGFGIGVGDSIGPPKFDINVEFFGVKGGGDYIAFLVDYSGSMNAGDRNQVMRRELIRTIEELPDGINIAIIPFSGPAWDISEDIGQVAKKWVHVKKEGGGDGGAGAFYPKTKDVQSEGQWVELKESTRRSFKKRILATPLVFGTVFDTSFYVACSMDPLPKTIFFMTDGSSSRQRGFDAIARMLSEIKRMKGAKALPIINTIGLEVVDPFNYYGLSSREQRDYDNREKSKIDRMDSDKAKAYEAELNDKLAKQKAWWAKYGGQGIEQKPEDTGSGKHLIDIAELGNGEAVFLSGEDYIKEHGRDRKIPWDDKKKLNEEYYTFEKTPPKQNWNKVALTAKYYKEFSLSK